MKTAQATKHCNSCGRKLPSAAFRRIYADRDWPRHSECSHCRNAQDRARRERRRRKTLQHQLTAMAAADGVQRIKALAASMIECAGGFDRLCEQFAGLWNDPKATPATQQRIFASVLRIACAADEAERFAAAQRQADDERQRELVRDELGRMSEQELEEHLASVLRRSGWRVTAPRLPAHPDDELTDR